MSGRPPSQDSLLIVDDDQVGREALRRRFERQSFKVTDAASGQEALDLLHTRRFDLILLDIQMPGMDGFETLRQIRVNYSVTDLPVIMITAKDQSQDVVRALQLGANDYITKPLDFSVVLARVHTQLSLNKAAHLRGVFGAQFSDCLDHFFPACHLETIEDGEPVRWRERPPAVNYRIGEMVGREGIGIEWFRSRYRFRPRRSHVTAAERRLVEVIVQVLDGRYRAMFDLEMPDRLELTQHAVEDWSVAEYLWSQRVLPVLEGIRLLRIAALLTYENRNVSTGILLRADDAGSGGRYPYAAGELPRLGAWLFQEKSLQRLCDGLHTLFMADRHGFLRGVVEIAPWSRQHHGSPLPGPCPRAYVNHARATLGGKDICLVLTPAQEIKAFAWGTPVFSFRGARWHLLDIPSKFATWCRALENGTCDHLPTQIFQAAMDLAEARRGALFVVLDRPEDSLAQLVAPEDRLTGTTAASKLMQRILQLTLQGAPITSFGPHFLEALSTIDGAVVFNRAGHVLAAGAILRATTAAGSGEAALEGARTTAAAAASHHGPVLKVSEDGLVTFFHQGQDVWHL